MALISALVSLGCTGIYSAMLPLTFKFGPENSNTIIMVTVFFMIIIYFIFYILAVIIAHYDNSMVEMLSNIRSLLVFVVFGILGLATFALTYKLSISTFNKKEL